MLAFVLTEGPGGVAYEVLNRAGTDTWVFRGDLAAVNRALDGAGFDPGVPALAAAGRVPHDGDWAGRVAGLLG